MAEVPIGTVVAYAGVLPANDNGSLMIVVPPDWLLCNGAGVSSTQFPLLWAAIQASHGNGSDDLSPISDFNLPDYRGLFLRGVNGPRTDLYCDPNRSDGERPANHPGGSVGNRVGSVQSDQILSHEHKTDDPGHSHTFGWGNEVEAGGLAYERSRDPRDASQLSTGSAKTNVTIQATGGKESRPKNAYVHYIIRAR